ncbi:MAG TPA: hypothetical protein VJZ00_19340 [Thermoanaerobaculia bacterium]|nr:hypothetical protein [Thermoanaerobaculia bacterium]
MKRLLPVIALALALPVAAQEMTIFDLNDFVDPRTLGAAASSTGKLSCPCVKFLISRAIVGWDHDFVNVMLPTDVDAGFAHLATSYYFGAWQANVKVMALRDVHRDRERFVAPGALPREAVTLQLGHYAAEVDGDRTTVGRVQATWRISRHLEPERDDVISPPPAPAVKGVISHEFGAEYDFQARGFVCSLSYTLLAPEDRNRTAFHERPSRLALIYRFDAFTWRSLRVEPTVSAGLLGHGAQLQSRLTIQPSARIVLPLGRTKVNLNARIAPTFQRHGGWHTYYETAFFADYAFFARTW